MTDTNTPPPPPPEGSQPPPPSSGSNDSNKKLMLVLSYFGILALIPYFLEKSDADVRWHSRHGIVLFIAEFISFVTLSILLFILGLIPILGPIIGILGCALWFVVVLAVVVFHIMCIVKAFEGQRMLTPISEYADRL